MASTRTFVIVGASMAGASAAETLRTSGFDGRIVLVGEEPARPYERPPLSKAYLSGEAGVDKVYLHDPSFYDDQLIELCTSTAATAIDPAAHTVALADGERLGYDQLLLSTGASPRRLPVPGADLDGVHYLRSLADTDRLKAAASTATSVAVIGAGWIGAEVTASLRHLGLPVALIGTATTPLERILGPEVGAVYRDLHAEHGVALHLGTSVESLRGAGSVEEVRTTHGQRIAADLVVVGVGATPRTELAAAAGLTVGNGIVVDEYLRTSHPDIYAAGDVANAWHPMLGTHIRVEHWANALNQGIAAAANLLGEPTRYERIPYFFSDQYDLGMEYSGYAPSWDRVVFRGDPGSREFLAFWLSAGTVVAGMNANIWDATDQIQQLVRARAQADPDRLAATDVPLESLISEHAGAGNG